MEPTGFKSRGSFGIPDHLKKQMEESVRTQPRKEEPRPAPPIPEPAPEPKAEVAEPLSDPSADSEDEDKKLKARERRQLLRTRDFWEDELEVKLTADDIRQYIFKGRLIKDVTVVAAEDVSLKVTLQTNTPADMNEIDERVASFRDKGKFTPDGLSNEYALWVLAYGWVKAEGRSLGATPEERYKNISQMGGELVNQVRDAWNGLNFLLRFKLKEKSLLKKS